MRRAPDERDLELARRAPRLSLSPRRALIAAIRVYQLVVSPHLGPGVPVRAELLGVRDEAIARRGVIRGPGSPQHGSGAAIPGGFGYDPVP